jgi:hypothetical protein
MLPSFLLPEAVIREDAEGPVVGLGPAQGKLLLLTLGITRIVEQESLDVAIWGSPDQVNWGAKPLASFPQKFYCGTYQLLLDLSEHADVQYLKAKCKLSRWGRGEPKPLFGAYLFSQEAQSRAAGGGA